MRHTPHTRRDVLRLGLCAAVLSLAVSSAFGDRFFNVQLSSAIWMGPGAVRCALIHAHEEARPRPGVWVNPGPSVPQTK